MDFIIAGCGVLNRGGIVAALGLGLFFFVNITRYARSLEVTLWPRLSWAA